MMAQADREVFAEEINDVNLIRIVWFYGVVLLLNTFIILFQYSFIRQVPPPLLPHVLDYICGPVFIAAALWLRRARLSLPWRSGFVWAFAAAQFGFANLYYFVLLPHFGPTTVYVINVVAMGVIILLPPGRFAALAAVSHAVYCVILFRWGLPVPETGPAIIDGTVGVVLACLAQWFLFASRAGQFEKSRELSRQVTEMELVMAIAAHDMRGPLDGLHNLIGLAARSEPWQRPPYGDLLGQARMVCENVLTLVTRLLESYSIDREGIPDSPQPGDLAECITGAVGRIRSRAAAKNIEIEWEAHPSPGPLNPSIVAGILDNLLSNAVKFSPQGTRVRVTLRSERRHWHIEVTDSGPGIPEAEREHLFEKFRQGPNRSTAGEPGAGLGLYIAGRYAQAIGATIRQGPGNSQGSVFSISIPRD